MDKNQDLLLSVIVPVYGVENYIRPCIESIFRQGLDEDCFEVIIVNDGTKDHSMEVIQDIIEQYKNITVLNQENQGLSVARNNGMARAIGEYLIFIDSDDLLIDNSLPFLLGKAMETNADLIVADYIEVHDKDINNTQIYTDKTILVTEKNGEELFIEDIDPHDCHVWHSLYKKEFLQHNNITFYKGIFFEDIPFTHECAIKAHKCLRIQTPMLIYRKGNELSVTSYFDKRLGLDFGTAIGKTWELTHTRNLSPTVVDKLRNDMFVSFSTLFCVAAHNISVPSEKMEILNNIKNVAPDIYFNNGLKQIFVSVMFWRMPRVYIALRLFYSKTFEEYVWELRKIIKKYKSR